MENEPKTREWKLEAKRRKIIPLDSEVVQADEGNVLTSLIFLRLLLIRWVTRKRLIDQNNGKYELLQISWKLFEKNVTTPIKFWWWIPNCLFRVNLLTYIIYTLHWRRKKSDLLNFLNYLIFKIHFLIKIPHYNIITFSIL